MKNFIKSVAGKITLFIVCNISVCILAVSVLGISIFTDSTLGFYTSSENAVKKALIEDNRIRSCAYSILWNEMFDANEKNYDVNYQIKDGSGKVVTASGNLNEDNDTVYKFSFAVEKDRDNNIIDILNGYAGNPVNGKMENYSVSLSLNENTPLYNEVNLYGKLLHIGYSLRYAVYFTALTSFALLIVCFIALMCSSGRKPDTDEIFPGLLHKVPFDLMVAFCIAAGIGAILLFDAVDDFTLLQAIILFSSCFAGFNVLLGLCMSVSCRIKTKTFLKNTVIYRAVKLLGHALKLIGKGIKFLWTGLPLVWKTGAVLLGLTLIELFFLLACSEDAAVLLFWAAEKIILIPAVIYTAIILAKLKKSGNALAKGELSYQTDTKGMFCSFKQHGENMNKIAEGMSIAVEERLKSERMKTELITNVSHDIKTPLTSIINYASLIGDESCDENKVREYSEVLVRQSEKLKRLLEDLVEISKACTGNLEVNLVPCEAGTFLTQASGEYEGKMKDADLTLILTQPERELKILADSRRMWRIFDNIMNNICKYALNGTRVYMSLEEQNKNAVITFKNTSRQALNMSAEELTERFTRGDASRNTEGNGLGLSIAKSMAECQGGSLKISIDGDLFKVILSFPLI